MRAETRLDIYLLAQIILGMMPMVSIILRWYTIGWNLTSWQQLITTATTTFTSLRWKFVFIIVIIVVVIIMAAILLLLVYRYNGSNDYVQLCTRNVVCSRWLMVEGGGSGGNDCRRRRRRRSFGRYCCQLWLWRFVRQRLLTSLNNCIS